MRSQVAELFNRYLQVSVKASFKQYCPRDADELPLRYLLNSSTTWDIQVLENNLKF